MIRSPWRALGACFLLASSLACGTDTLRPSQPHIQVTATHVDEAGQALLDFGKISVLDERTLHVLVENLGRAPLELKQVALEDASGVFRLDAGYDHRQLGAGESLEIAVTFQPAELADYEGRFILEHSDSHRPTVEIRLIGSGSTVGQIEVDPGSIDFGVVGEGMQETRTLTLRSVGTGTLVIASVELMGGPIEFAFLGSTNPARLPPPAGGQPGGAVDLRIACAPTAATEEAELSGFVRIVTNDPENREVLVPLHALVNRAPVAVIEVASGVHVPEVPIGLDGSGSYDPDGHVPLGYEWRIFDQPFGALATIVDPTAAITELLTDVPGDYEVGLDVVDAEGLYCYPPDGNPSVPCDRKKLTVKSDTELEIVLVWDHAITDLDLHVLENDAPLYSSGDCYWANPNPDFGVFGDSTDDPIMTHESLKGFGPERVIFPKPAGGTYRVQVVFDSAKGAPDPATKAIVRVYVFGILRAEVTKELGTPSQVWDVLAIEWPSAVLTTIDTVHPAVTP